MADQDDREKRKEDVWGKHETMENELETSTLYDNDPKT